MWPTSPQLWPVQTEHATTVTGTELVAGGMSRLITAAASDRRRGHADAPSSPLAGVLVFCVLQGQSWSRR